MALGTWQGVYLCEHRDVGGFGAGQIMFWLGTCASRVMTQSQRIKFEPKDISLWDIASSFGMRIEWDNSSGSRDKRHEVQLKFYGEVWPCGRGGHSRDVVVTLPAGAGAAGTVGQGLTLVHL